MAAALGAGRPVGAPGGREGAGGLQGGARIPGARLERLRGLVEEPLLVTAPANIRYLTGLDSTNAALLVESGGATLFTDFRYAERAREVESVEVVETKRYLYSDLPSRLPERVAFEADAMTYANYEFLREGGVELVPRRGVVESLRAVKGPEELDAIRRATEVTNRAYEAMAEEHFAGRTERELAWRMEQLLRELGGERLAFPVDRASGPTAASPHAVSGDRVVEEGDLVLLDAGAVVDGYCSDCTRTFAVGEISEPLAEIYELVRLAEEKGVAAVRAGTVGRDVDAAARAVIAEAGYGENFGHGLGHGVGLLVHEAPVLRAESQDELAPGNVVTVEPGIYLSGTAGVRIEDLVVVTGDGCEVLTTFPKELTTVH